MRLHGREAHSLIMPQCRLVESLIVQFVRVDVIQSLWFAHTHTLRGPIAQIAFKGNTSIPIKCHHAKWTRRYTHLTPNAQIRADHHPVQFVIPPYGLIGADRQAWGVLALLACHGQKESAIIIPLDDVYATSRRIVCGAVPQCARTHAVFAARTFRGIYGKCFCCHGLTLSQIGLRA
jgi:hypothetical protein